MEFRQAVAAANHEVAKAPAQRTLIQGAGNGRPVNYGYARVSTREQKEDRQILALMEQGVDPVNIFVDKQSGKDFERPNYRSLINLISKNDTLFIKSIDRLGRNYLEILEQWRIITKEIGASIVVIDMPLLDTRQKERDLIGTLIADIVLQLLSYVAETEREYNRQRQAEGIAVAKSKGVRFGRPPREKPKEFHLLRKAYLKREVTARDAARQLRVTHKTFCAWVKEEEV
jgi:DNA invertase Pin-like site-specific DNA recombinase